MSQPPELTFVQDRLKGASARFGEQPRIIMTGKTGAGKSSLVNALLGKPAQQVDVIPCTMEMNELDWSAGDADFKLLDVPGFAEADKHAMRSEFILAHIPEAHIALLVIGAPDRALEHESRFLTDVRGVEANFPLIVAANRIDMLNPVRDWRPRDLNLSRPKTAKEQNISKWMGEVRRVCQGATSLVPVAAGERYDDRENQYGLEDLQRAIFNALPKATQNYAARALRLEELKTNRAMAVIWTNAVAAAALGAIPIPVADALPITVLQAEMIISIGFIFGVDLSLKNAATMLGPALAAVGGPLLVKELAKLIPGVGSAVGAGVAGAMTLGIGHTFLYLFAKGDFEPDPAEVKELFKERYNAAKNHQEDLKREAKQREGQ